MSQFLEKIQQYITEHQLGLEASIENKIVYQNLVLKDAYGETQTFKIETVKFLPPANRTYCHSATALAKIDPTKQPEQWLEHVLNLNPAKSNTFKMK